MTPSTTNTAALIAAAEAMGAKGGPYNEDERLAFEAWMQGHCWALHAEWDGAGYKGDLELRGRYCEHAVRTRMLWAAWRDRAALTQQQGGEQEAGDFGQQARELLAAEYERIGLHGVGQALRGSDPGVDYIILAALRAITAALRTKQPAASEGGGFDMLAHLQRQREWSGRTFGPGPRTAGVIDHIRKELREIEADPTDTSEWIDVVILALDGAWRAGASAQTIIDTLVAKQTKNEGRVWPDWRTMPADKAIEHDRSHDNTSKQAAGEAVAYPVSGDREVLLYLMQQFDGEEFYCRCGRSEKCADMDSAGYLRRYLADNPTPPRHPADEVADATDLALLLVARCLDTNSERAEFRLEGVTDSGKAAGDWIVMVAPSLPPKQGPRHD